MKESIDPVVADHSVVHNLRIALRGVLNRCKATNKAAQDACSVAEATYLASFSPAEKARVVSVARAWQKEKAGTGYFQDIALNGFDDVVRCLGISMVDSFLVESQGNAPEASSDRNQPPAGWAPVLVGKAFPMVVTVVAYDASMPEECRASGVLYENGEVLISYPFLWVGREEQSGKCDTHESEGQIDLSYLILPDGSEFDRHGGAWREVAHVPSVRMRIDGAVLALMYTSAQVGKNVTNQSDLTAMQTRDQAMTNLQLLLDSVPLLRATDASAGQIGA